MNGDDRIAQEISSLARSNEDSKFEYYGPVEEALIRATEAELDMRFPRSYRAFVRRFGAAFVCGYAIVGISDRRSTDEEPPYWQHVADVNLSLWRVQIPRHYLYITSDGGDYYYYLDTSRLDENNECPVVVLGPGADGTTVAETFLDFLRKLSKREELF